MPNLFLFAPLAYKYDETINASISDCVSFELVRIHHPEVAERLRILAFTQEFLGLPYVTDVASADEDIGDMREGS